MIDFLVSLIGSEIADYPFLLAAAAMIPINIVFFLFYSIFYNLMRLR